MTFTVTVRFNFHSQKSIAGFAYWNSQFFITHVLNFLEWVRFKDKYVNRKRV